MTHSEMLEQGYIISPSARTKQDLRINSTWLSEQLEDPEAHDVLLQTSRLRCPACIIHSENDDAVDHRAGVAIAKASKSELITLNGGNHVLNMPNPGKIEDDRSEQLLKATAQITRFIGQ